MSEPRLPWYGWPCFRFRCTRHGTYTLTRESTSTACPVCLRERQSLTERELREALQQQQDLAQNTAGWLRVQLARAQEGR